MPVKPLEMPFEHDFEATLPNLLHHAVRKHGDREFLVQGDQRLTFADAERSSAELARGFLAMGLGKGSRVGILMPNCPDWVLTYLAAARVGAHTISLSTFYQAPEIDWALRFNDIDTLVISATYLKHDYIERLERAIPGLANQQTNALHLPTHPYLRRIIVCGDCDRPWALRGLDCVREAAMATPQIDDAFLASVESNVVPADILLTICTSGTTAEPKAVVHTHGTAVRTTNMFGHFQRLRPGERIYGGYAFFWIGGHNIVLMPCLFVGCTAVFTLDPSSEAIVEAVVREKLTILGVWPAQSAGIREFARRTGADLSSLKQEFGGPVDEYGDPIPPDRLSRSMGMTETFGMHSMEKSNTTAPYGKDGNWGRHLPGVERIVVDPESGRVLGPDEEGELYVRGATLMHGYYKRERQDVFTRDGFFATGDLVVIDEDDYLYFNGRRTEMIKTAGANVAPREVEVALSRIAGVREPIVFGIPDEAKGELVVAVIVPDDGVMLDPEAVKSFMKQEVSGYKVPHIVLFMDYEEVPRTATGKPVKRDLAALAQGL